MTSPQSHFAHRIPIVVIPSLNATKPEIVAEWNLIKDPKRTRDFARKVLRVCASLTKLHLTEATIHELYERKLNSNEAKRCRCFGRRSLEAVTQLPPIRFSAIHSRPDHHPQGAAQEVSCGRPPSWHLSGRPRADKVDW